MSTLLPYNFDGHSQYASRPSSSIPSHRTSRRIPTADAMPQVDDFAVSSVAAAASESTTITPSSPASRTLDFMAPANPPQHTLTVGQWAGAKRIIPANDPFNNQPICGSEQDCIDDVGWRDVHRNIKRMDQLYDATFYSWLKSEDNVLVTAMYLHRIANEYDLERITNALKWLVSDWRWESTSILVRHVTADWTDATGDLKRAYLLRHLTQHWATQYTATLVTTILATAPYVTADNAQRERFLRAFTQEWDFSKLSEFFMYLQSRANIDYKLKCVMLQEAARRERETLSAKLNNRKKRMTKHKDKLSSTTASKHCLADGQAMVMEGEVEEEVEEKEKEEAVEEKMVNRQPVDSTDGAVSITMSRPEVHACSSNLPDTGDMLSTANAAAVFPVSTSAASANNGHCGSNGEVNSSSGNDSNSIDSTHEGEASASGTWRHHHRRTSSNDVADMNKRFRLSRPDLNVESAETVATSSSVGCISSTTSPDPSPSSSAVMHPSTTVATTSRRAATPDHAHHHHFLRCPSSATAPPQSMNTTTAATSSPRDTGAANAVSSELSHLHLGRARRNGSSASTTSATNVALPTAASVPTTTVSNPPSPQTSSSNPPVVDVFSSSLHSYYQAGATTASHFQVHDFRLRRRSSSSSSTCSNASTGSTSSYRDPPAVEEDVSSVRKRTSPMSTNGRNSRRFADE